MSRPLPKGIAWLASSKGQGTGFSLLSMGRMSVAVLTYVKQMLIAGYFGLSWQTDAFAVAHIVTLLVQQVIADSVGTSFIPVLSDVMESRGREAADRLLSRIMVWVTIIGSALVVLLFLEGRSVVSLMGPGLAPDTRTLSALMLRIMLPVMVLSTIKGFLLGLLTYHRRYGLRAIGIASEVLFALVVLVAGRELMGAGIIVLPVASLVSVCLSFLLALFFALKVGFRFRRVVSPMDPDFMKLVRMASPVVIGVLFGFLGPVTDKMLASLLDVDSVTALTYADRIKNIALGVLILPLATLADVSFSRQAARMDMDSLKRKMHAHLGRVSLMMLPMSILLTVLAAPIVSVMFQRGSFTSENSRLVGYALAFYAPWLAQYGIGVMLLRAFYAVQHTVTTVVIGVWGLIVNVLLNFILIGPLGIGGLALATTVSSTGKTLMYAYFLKRYTGPIGGGRIALEMGRHLGAGALMTGALLGMRWLLPVGLDAPFASRLLHLAAWAVPSLLVYALAARMLGSETLAEMTGKVRSALARRGGRG